MSILDSLCDRYQRWKKTCVGVVIVASLKQDNRVNYVVASFLEPTGDCVATDFNRCRCQCDNYGWSGHGKHLGILADTRIIKSQLRNE